MVDSILLHQRRILPCSVYLQDEYGYSGIFLGVPVRLGSAGVEEVLQIDLSEPEKRPSGARQEPSENCYR
jgi:malate dehydrogenase